MRSSSESARGPGTGSCCRPAAYGSRRRPGCSSDRDRDGLIITIIIPGRPGPGAQAAPAESQARPGRAAVAAPAVTVVVGLGPWARGGLRAGSSDRPVALAVTVTVVRVTAYEPRPREWARRRGPPGGGSSRSSARRFKPSFFAT